MNDSWIELERGELTRILECLKQLTNALLVRITLSKLSDQAHDLVASGMIGSGVSRVGYFSALVGTEVRVSR